MVKEPRNRDSVIGQVWTACDELEASVGAQNFTRAEVIAACPNVNPGTCTTQFQRWKEFHGISKIRGANKDGAKPGPKKKAVAKKKASAKKAPAKKKASAKKRGRSAKSSA